MGIGTLGKRKAFTTPVLHHLGKSLDVTLKNAKNI